jgi:AcrR family transcriptional regulator
MTIPTPVVRTRNAAATRAAILDSARIRFAKEGYDGASVRELAADAGVDPALISRYFGSKEELFVAVLDAGGASRDFFEGDVATFGERISRMLLGEEREPAKFDKVMIMLRSCSSPTAAEAVRRASRGNFMQPFAEWLGGQDAHIRAQLAGAVMMGVSMARALNEDLDLTPDERERLRVRLAEILQRAVEP